MWKISDTILCLVLRRNNCFYIVNISQIKLSRNVIYSVIKMLKIKTLMEH